MLKQLVVFILLNLFISCQGQQTLLQAVAFSDKLKTTETKHLVDVRTPDEFNEGYINGAKNIDWNSSQFETELGKLDRSTPLFLYCLSGGRSGNAARKAVEMGFTSVYALEGGTMAWRTNNLPIVMLGNIKKAGMTLEEYEALYKGKSKKILVDFYADWCMPCQKMKPYLKKISEKMAKDVEVIRINADHHPELCQKLGVSGLPYLLIYVNDQIEWKRLGYVSEEELTKLLKK
jgi:thioredoxin 1